MPKKRKKLNKPKAKTNNVTTWNADISPDDIPYVSHVPKSPIKMTAERKKRIRKIVKMSNTGMDPEEIAEELDIDVVLVKRDLTTATMLVSKYSDKLPAEEQKMLLGAVNSYQSEISKLIKRVQKVLTKLEDEEAYMNPKHTPGFAMILSELRQNLELGAKISGELQTGTKVNVNVFSSLAKRIVEIVSEEVDRQTFLRIRDRIALELHGQKPLGQQGGDVNIITEE